MFSKIFHISLISAVVFLLCGCQHGDSPLSGQNSTLSVNTVIEAANTPAPTNTHKAATSTPFQPIQPTPTTTASPTPTPVVCKQTKGNVQSTSLQTEWMNEPFNFLVYTPPCYGSNADLPAPPAKGYPVLYMFHGQTFNEDQWGRLGITQVADQLISDNLSPAFIIVMPREPDTFADIFTSGFADAIIKDLIPLIDKEYDTCTERNCRAIGGLSRGGAWAIHLGFKYWQLFGAIGAHSTPPFYGEVTRVHNAIKEIPQGDLPDIYMDIGKSDVFRPNATEMQQYFSNYGIPHEWILNDGAHTEAYWQEHVTEYLLWYTSHWQTE